MLIVLQNKMNAMSCSLGVRPVLAPFRAEMRLLFVDVLWGVMSLWELLWRREYTGRKEAVCECQRRVRRRETELSDNNAQKHDYYGDHFTVPRPSLKSFFVELIHDSPCELARYEMYRRQYCCWCESLHRSRFSPVDC